MTGKATIGPAFPTRGASKAGGAAARVALVGGVTLLGAAGVLLWATEGAGVFLESAFAGVIACF